MPWCIYYTLWTAKNVNCKLNRTKINENNEFVICDCCSARHFSGFCFLFRFSSLFPGAFFSRYFLRALFSICVCASRALVCVMTENDGRDGGVGEMETMANDLYWIIVNVKWSVWKWCFQRKMDVCRRGRAFVALFVTAMNHNDIIIACVTPKVHLSTNYIISLKLDQLIIIIKHYKTQTWKIRSRTFSPWAQQHQQQRK